jgi:restriction endonuclease S subunit
MPKHEDYITLGQLIDARAVEITLGFPCGSHNCDGEGIPHIRPFNIQPNGKISLEQIKSIPLDLASRKPTLCQGDIVFNNTNTKELVGKCAVWEGNQEFVFSNHMTRIRVHDKHIDNAYLNFAILHHWFTGKSEMLARSHVAQASIIGERFREILLPWRSTNEQALIANLLTQTHRAISFQEKQIHNTLQLKSVVMNELFTPANLQNEMPESYVSLDQICDLISIQINPQDFLDSLYIGLEHLTSSMFRRIGGGKASDVHSSKFSFNSGDILYGKLRPYLDKAIITDCNGICTTELLVLRPKINVSSEFLISVVHRPDFIEFSMSGVTGAQHPRTSWNHIKNFRLIDYNQKEMKEIAKTLKTIDRKIDLHKKKQIVLEDLFKTILHKLMTGESRVSELDPSTLKKSVDIIGAFA